MSERERRVNNIFKKVLDGVNDPQSNNPDHIRQEKRDKEKEYSGLTEVRTERDKQERGE
jgi:hypothetical protein